jgi:tetratricopeptide (TPR) repeat protein
MRRHPTYLFFLSLAASTVLIAGSCLAAPPETPPSPRTAPGASSGPAAPALPGPAAKGQTAPDSPEVRAKLLADLYANLATAEDEIHAKPMAEAIERLWLHSGSDTVDVLMQRAYAAIQAKRHDLALKLLDTVVELAPDFAEGWNRRAYVFYSQNEFERALGDLRRALALEPNHFKALDGLGQIMKELGRKKAALKAFKELMAINPNFPGIMDTVNELQREVEGQGI